MEVTQIANIQVHSLPDGRYTATLTKKCVSEEVTISVTSRDFQAVVTHLYDEIDSVGVQSGASPSQISLSV